MKPGDTPLRMTADTRTPCCSRVPRSIGSGRYVCRGCGVIFFDAGRWVGRFFGKADVTSSMTPERFRRAGADSGG